MWNETTRPTTSWTEETIDTLPDILYNDDIPYNADYIVYGGDYIRRETDWTDDSRPSTTWS